MKKFNLLIAGMPVGLMLLPSLGASCPKCYSAAGQQVLNAYYLSIAFMSLIPLGIIGAILIWIYRQTRHQYPSYEKSD
jgi:hypothetical protein